MYLYFEDWSAFIGDLDKKNLPHDGKIVKVFASEQDPRVYFDDPRLKVVEIDATPLHDQVFRFHNQRVFQGEEIEVFMADLGLHEPARQIVRSLLQFADRTEIWQGEMGIRVSCRRLINHPLDKVDGLFKAAAQPQARTRIIHIDVFTAPALQKLKTIVDHDNGQLLVPALQGTRFKTAMCSLIEDRHTPK
jgi:hypothetical protein